MSGVIDTNILLYAVNQDAVEHAAARAFLEQIGRSTARWYLTEGILYEFLRVVTHPRVFHQPLTASQALQFVHPLTAPERFVILCAGHRHWTQLAALLDELTHPSGNLFFDIRTAALMREHGIRTIYSTDTDFLQFRDLEVINPLKGVVP